ncbi:MAG: PP2C family serine/threonine-protein phosphatase [Bdellovibrionales bacterium]
MSHNQNADTAEFEIFLPDWNGQPAQQTPPVFIDFGALSHPGRVRQNNEDHFLIFRLNRTFDTLLSNLPAGQLPTHFSQEAYSMVVADGMGGMAAGEVASSLAIRAGVNILLNDGRWTFHID